jgi:catechol 2,3-dioxygenase-like lactoylglutathione lyase family enzyme
MSLTVNAIDHLVINVNDVEVSAAWYQKALGMRREEFHLGPGTAPRVALKFGIQKLNLRPKTTNLAEWFTGRHPTAGSEDLCFLTQCPPQHVLEHLRSCAIVVEVGPVEKQGAKGPLTSVYCRDPDGNLIEIASYPP